MGWPRGGQDVPIRLLGCFCGSGVPCGIWGSLGGVWGGSLWGLGVPECPWLSPSVPAGPCGRSGYSHGIEGWDSGTPPGHGRARCRQSLSPRQGGASTARGCPWGHATAAGGARARAAAGAGHDPGERIPNPGAGSDPGGTRGQPGGTRGQPGGTHATLAWPPPLFPVLPSFSPIPPFPVFSCPSFPAFPGFSHFPVFPDPPFPAFPCHFFPKVSPVPPPRLFPVAPSLKFFLSLLPSFSWLFPIPYSRLFHFPPSPIFLFSPFKTFPVFSLSLLP